MPPEALIKDCDPIPPLDLPEFKLAILDFKLQGVENDWEAAFLVQTRQWFKQTDQLGLCNLQMIQLRQWYLNQSVLMNENINTGGPISRSR